MYHVYNIIVDYLSREKDVIPLESIVDKFIVMDLGYLYASYLPNSKEPEWVIYYSLQKNGCWIIISLYFLPNSQCSYKPFTSYRQPKLFHVGLSTTLYNLV